MDKKLLFIVAIIVGSISIFPYIYAYQNLESINEEKLHYFYQDSELVYLSRIREVTEGRLNISSPAFNEYKEIKNIQQPFGEWMYAAASLGNSDLIPIVAMVSKFVLPALLFMILYLLVVRLMVRSQYDEKVSQTVGLFVAAVVVLGYDLTNVGYLSQVFSHTFNAPQLSLWTRMVNPIIGALGFFLVSYFVLMLYQKQRALWVILAGLTLGLTAGYIFSFAIGMVFVAIMLCFAILEKNWNRVKSFGAIIVIALLMNSTYLYSLMTASTDAAALQKNGLLLTHQFLHNKVLYIALLSFVIASLYVYLRNRDKEVFWKSPAWQWQVSAMLAGFVCLNEQVITGKTVWPGHFVQFTNPIGYIVFSISALTIFSTFIQNENEKYRKYCGKVVIGACILGIVALCAINFSTIPSVITNKNEFQNIQRYIPVIEWLNKNADEECVIFPVEEFEKLGQYIPAYTSCDVYHSSYVFFAVPPERIMHNYIVHLRLMGVTEKTIDAYLDTHENDMRQYFFNNWAEKFSDGNDTWVFNTTKQGTLETFIPNAKTMVTKEYKRTVNIPLNDLLHQYKITYIIVDTHHDSLNDEMEQYPVVFTANNLMLLKLP